MDWVRTPDVAGLFYPADESALSRLVADLLEEAPEPPARASRPKALIAPHAGYVYSGPVAASVYARLHPFRESLRRVVLLGPAHRYPFRGLAASSASAFETPLGSVPVDKDALARALGLPQVRILDQAHEGEHSLEVHLPFLQVVLGEFRVLPLVVGEASHEDVAGVLRELWGGEETLVVISSDLSHFLPYERAGRLDEATARSIEALRPKEIRHDQACGRIPLGGLLIRAREEGLEVERVDLRNSGDTAGPRDRVVGYGSFLFTLPAGTTGR
jgi:AmmeMemoRadiSam system protein B